MDIVYMLKDNTTDSTSIYLSLLSVMKFTKKEKIHIVTNKLPDWLVGKVNHIEMQDQHSVVASSLAKVLKACLTQEVSKDFFLYHDDFIHLQPTRFEPIMYHRGLLRDSIVMKRKMLEQSFYMELYKNSMDNPDTCLDYALHLPIPINKQEFLDFMDSDLVKAKTGAWSWRLLYGNYSESFDKVYHGDVKVFEYADFELLKNERVVSFTDTSIKDCAGEIFDIINPTPKKVVVEVRNRYRDVYEDRIVEKGEVLKMKAPRAVELRAKGFVYFDYSL